MNPAITLYCIFYEKGTSCVSTTSSQSSLESQNWSYELLSNKYLKKIQPVTTRYKMTTPTHRINVGIGHTTCQSRILLLNTTFCAKYYLHKENVSYASQIATGKRSKQKEMGSFRGINTLKSSEKPCPKSLQLQTLQIPSSKESKSCMHDNCCEREMRNKHSHR